MRTSRYVGIAAVLVALALATSAWVRVSQVPSGTSLRAAVAARSVSPTIAPTTVLDPTCTQLTASAYTLSCAFSVSAVGGDLTGGVLSFATTTTPNDQGAALATPATPGCTLDVTATDQGSTCQVVYPGAGTYYTQTVYDGGPGAYSASATEPVSVSAPAPVPTTTSIGLTITPTYVGPFTGGVWGDYERCYVVVATATTTDASGHVVASPPVSLGFDTSGPIFPALASGAPLSYCIEFFADPARGQTSPTGTVTIALSPPRQLMRPGEYVVGGIALPTEVTATADYAGTATDAASQGTATANI